MKKCTICGRSKKEADVIVDLNGSYVCNICAYESVGLICKEIENDISNYCYTELNRDIDSWINKKVRHFKGKEYLVEDIVWHTETNDYMVKYRALYGDCKSYVRPLVMFMSRVNKEKNPEATQEFRMELITE